MIFTDKYERSEKVFKRKIYDAIGLWEYTKNVEPAFVFPGIYGDV